MTNDDTVIAFGLLTRADLDRLGSSFSRSYPIAETPGFGGLLAAIDEAEREQWRARDARAGSALMPRHDWPDLPTEF